MRDFYEHIETAKRYRIYQRISDGVILTSYNEKTGICYGNTEYLFYVSDSKMKSDYKKITFIPKLNAEEKKQENIQKTLREIIINLECQGPQGIAVLERCSLEVSEFHHLEHQYNGLRKLVAWITGPELPEADTFISWFDNIISRTMIEDEFEYVEPYQDVLHFAYVCGIQILRFMDPETEKSSETKEEKGEGSYDEF